MFSSVLELQRPFKILTFYLDLNVNLKKHHFNVLNLFTKTLGFILLKSMPIFQAEFQ